MTKLRKRIGSVDNLVALEAVVRHGSFTSAARELLVSQPAISRRIRDLEAGLGVPLFLRNGKRITVTPAARQLHAALVQAFADIEQTVSEISRPSRFDGVTLRLTPSASSWILPALGSLCDAFPETPVHLVCIDVRANLVQNDYDLQLRFTTPRGHSEHRYQLLEGEAFPVMSPRFAERHGSAERLELQDQPLLQVQKPFARVLDWRTWLTSPKRGQLHLRNCPTYAAAIEGAMTARGVALAWRYSVGPHIEAGRLVRGLDATKRSRFCEYLFVSPDRARDPAVCRVVDWLRDYAERYRRRFRDI